MLALTRLDVTLSWLIKIPPHPPMVSARTVYSVSLALTTTRCVAKEMIRLCWTVKRLSRIGPVAASIFRTEPQNLLSALVRPKGNSRVSNRPVVYIFESFPVLGGSHFFAQKKQGTDMAIATSMPLFSFMPTAAVYRLIERL